ncbi:hypothetical protein QFC24_005724 [Naganishia onofrii]|uniref:Uncharacterized protein n=1 Tax=Naganishia onofrii TaxID=1851511 RepID=A0ACC2X804_9TREE|nr:hypothetical protein QFC24_005724 [Naganishia onofrii]
MTIMQLPYRPSIPFPYSQQAPSIEPDDGINNVDYAHIVDSFYPPQEEEGQIAAAITASPSGTSVTAGPDPVWAYAAYEPPSENTPAPTYSAHPDMEKEMTLLDGYLPPYESSVASLRKCLFDITEREGKRGLHTADLNLHIVE